MREVQVHGLKELTYTGLQKTPDPLGLVDLHHSTQLLLGSGACQKLFTSLIYRLFLVCFFTKGWWSYAI